MNIRFTVKLSCYSIQIGNRTSTITVGGVTRKYYTIETEKEFSNKRAELEIGNFEMEVPLAGGTGTLDVVMEQNLNIKFSGTDYGTVTLEGVIIAG